MADLLRRIDQLLRSESAGGDVTGRLVPIRVALIACAILGLVAGACTGVYAVANHDTVNVSQLVASSFKVPLLFLLTLVVTFPSLYVFSALLGVELYPPALLRMILSAIVVTLALSASFGPITAFFALSTENYHFMVVLTVLVFGFGGAIGLVFLLRALRSVLRQQAAAHAAASAARDAAADATNTSDTQDDADDAAEGRAELVTGADLVTGQRDAADEAEAADAAGNQHIASLLFRIWVVVYGLVGAQMAWVLRPFIGDPDAGFTLFRARESNFFASVLGHLRDLLF